jgi:hypothetical protein
MMDALVADPVDALLDDFNAQFFVVNENGKAVIYRPRHDDILDRRLFDRLSFADFNKLYCNRFVQVGVNMKTGRPIMRAVPAVWLNHPRRRQYTGGITFDPARRNGDDVFNLWSGFAVEPRPGSWDRLREHIDNVICGGHTALSDYVLNWMADLVQHPARQGEVAMVMRGIEGCGKGTLGKVMLRILGQHGLAISNSRHLVGNFNAHLRDVCFLFCDEAFYAGDKQHIGVLKSLVTEPYLTIEGKFQNAVQAPNFLHVMMASNEQWVVPAGLASRRWLVLDVLDKKVGDYAYFAAICQEMENGGLAAMLNDLLARDLTLANLRAVPDTPALLDQRKRSLDAIHAWWLDCLYRGYVFASRLGLEDHFQQWHEFLATELLYASYQRFCEQRHERHPQPRELFGGWVATMGGEPTRRRNEVVGEHIVDSESTDQRHARIAELVKQPFVHGYRLGTLEDARVDFCDRTGLAIAWPGDTTAIV